MIESKFQSFLKLLRHRLRIESYFKLNNQPYNRIFHRTKYSNTLKCITAISGAALITFNSSYLKNQLENLVYVQCKSLNHDDIEICK